MLTENSLCFLIFADNGGGMDPDKMRQCMSLGYSVKSNQANTIGQCETLILRKDIIHTTEC